MYDLIHLSLNPEEIGHVIDHRTHIADDVSTYSIVLLVHNYDLLTQRVERVEAAMYCVIGAAPCMYQPQSLVYVRARNVTSHTVLQSRTGG